MQLLDLSLYYYLFIFFVSLSLLLVRLFSSCNDRGLLSSCARASHCSGFSCCRAQAPGVGASVVAAHVLSSRSPRALERRRSSPGTWA